MQIDNHLKETLLQLRPSFRETIPIYAIRQLKADEQEKNAHYLASKFMNRDIAESFRSSIKRSNNSTVVILPEGTKMRIYNNSNCMVIKKKMGPLENLITKKLDEEQLKIIAADEMKKLELERWQSTSEHIEFERLWRIKAGGITIGKKVAPEVLCRLVGSFRRHINKIPVYGRASIFVKVAGENMVESTGIDWRFIEKEPIDNVEIIQPEVAAETIMRNLSSYSPKSITTSETYKPEFFSLGYFSQPKNQPQNYMQPVYVAMFKSIGWTTLNRLIVIPASVDNYEGICRVSTSPQQPNQNKKQFK